MIWEYTLSRRVFWYLKYACVTLLFIVFHVVFNVGSALAIVYVDSAGAGGDGKTWGTAYRTIEAAIAGSSSDQEFWIAGGTYTPVSSLTPRLGTSFYGGFSGNETNKNQRNITLHPSIIDGLGTLHHLFVINNDNVRLDGLVIQGGAATGSGASENIGGGVFINRATVLIVNSIFQNNVAQAGGAIYAYEADVEILTCQFTGNQAGVGSGGRGGAIWAYNNSLRVVGCSFENNSAGSMGGAVELNYTPDALISSCTFLNNSVTDAGSGGGAVSLQWANQSPEITVIIEKSLFENNISELEGGGLYSNRVHVIVKSSRFIGNTAANGGAIMLDDVLSLVSTIERCLFLNNTANIIGGAIRSYGQSVDIENSIFSHNKAVVTSAAGSGNAGAVGLMNAADGSPHHNPNYEARLRNCTFYGNSAGAGGGAIGNSNIPMMYLSNCIFWGNNAVDTYYNNVTGTHQISKDVANYGSSSMTIYYTDMETLDWAHGTDIDRPESHTGSFSLDPLFVDPDGKDNILGTLDDNFQLQVNSPCIDRADGDKATECDTACYPRIDHSNIPILGTGSPDYADIGALERIEHPATSPCSSCSVTPPYIPPSTRNVVIPPIIYLLLNSYGNGGTT